MVIFISGTRRDFVFKLIIFLLMLEFISSIKEIEQIMNDERF